MIDLISEIRNGFTELRVGQKRQKGDFSRARRLLAKELNLKYLKICRLYEFEKWLKLT